MDGQVGGRMHEWVHGRMEGWGDGRVHGREGGREGMDGWML